MENLGDKIRKRRKERKLTLEAVSVKTGISKPYLSLIENGRLNNPPVDAKIQLLEQTLGFVPNELLSIAHYDKTPADVRDMLKNLLLQNKSSSSSTTSKPINLDSLYRSGALHEFVDQRASNVEIVRIKPIPVINKVSAGYPKDFTDLSYPQGVADDYVSCPDVDDPSAFGARVQGDSMSPRYSPGDLVIFSPQAQVKSGDDCFIRFQDGNTTFKRAYFEKNETEEPVIRLQPRNQKYRAQIVVNGEITGLYKAVYRYLPIGNEE
jgi:repressor LexA